MSKIFINTNAIDNLQELEIALIKNTTKAEIIRKEIKKLKEVETYEPNSQIVKPIVELREKFEQEEIDNNEYSYYYDDIKDVDIDVDVEQLKRIIRDSLPSKENVNYFKIVSRIKAELKKEHIGQIKLYMNYIDKNIKTINQDNTIGIVIVKKDNNFIMEYVSDNRIYQTTYEILKY